MGGRVPWAASCGIVALAMLVPALAGCGQKGPLVLPPGATAPAGAASAPTAPR